MAKSEVLQHCVSLCKAFPGLGTPTRAARYYEHFPESFFESLPRKDEFTLDILALSEHNTREAERQDKAREEADAERENAPKKRKFSMKEAAAIAARTRGKAAEEDQPSP